MNSYSKPASSSLPWKIVFRQGWISAEQLQALVQPLTKNGYGQYLLRILKESVF